MQVILYIDFDIPMDVRNCTMDVETEENSISSIEDNEQNVEIENISSKGIT